MAVNINVPSQVKTYANLAAFPATGALKTIYIAEDTNKTYRWTGSVYVEVSGADFSGYVPTSRTLTINGTTQDLSADRTFTISTGITIGTTAITSGVVGRVLFEGAGNVVQESANLFWDNTNGRLGVGTSTPDVKLHIFDSFRIGRTGFPSASSGFIITKSHNTTISQSGGDYIDISSALFVRNNGNIGINTTTDAGFKLDVNGTARFKDTGSAASIIMQYGTGGWIAVNNAGGTEAIRLRGGGGPSYFNTGQNVLIGTTTDAGFRLDVNGTARFKGTGTTSATTAFTVQDSASSNLFIVRDDGQFGKVNATNFGTFNIAGTSASTSAAIFQNGSSGFSGFRVQLNAQTLIDEAGVNAFVNSSAIFELKATTKGFLPPRMTTTQRNAIASPAAGLMVYDTTMNVIMYYNGTMWI